MPDVRELLHDSVDGDAAAPIAAIEARATRLRTRDRRRHLVGTAAVVALVIAAIALVARNDGAEQHRVITRPPAPAPTPTPERVFPFTLGDVAIDGDDVWVADSTPVTGTVHRLDRRTLEVATIDLPTVEDAHMIDVGPSGVWVGTAGYGEQITGGDVVRIDPVTNRVTAHLDASGLGRWDPSDLVVTKEAVWVADGLGQRLLRVDPRTAKVVETYPCRCTLLRADGGIVWAGGGGLELVTVPAGGGEARHFAVSATGLAAADDGTAWVVTSGKLERYRSDGGHEAIGAVSEMAQLAATRDGVWIADIDGLRRLDLSGDHVPGTELHRRPRGSWNVDAVDGEVWWIDSAQTTRWRP